VAQGINADARRGRCADRGRARRGVIFVDQRGTFKAQPLLSCPSYDEFLIRGFALAPTSSTYAGREVAAVGTCRRSWVARGYDLWSGRTPLTWLTCESRCASRVGTCTASPPVPISRSNYPAGIRSEVLESVVPPQVNVATGFWAKRSRGVRKRIPYL